MRRSRVVVGIMVALAVMLAALADAQLPVLGANGLLHPARQISTKARPAPCEDAQFQGYDGVVLRGWRCGPTRKPERGTIVYLHGIADNRGSATGVVDRFTTRGFDVIAYDSRAHGDSGGNACTYGFFESQDLRRIVGTIRNRPIILIGTSLGAAVALQEAADDSRVAAVIAAETFSDLRTVATERAPAFFSRRVIDKAFEYAEREGGLRIDAVSPLIAATRITAPVLLIHGAEDVDTPPSHSQRIYAALNARKRLMLVLGARHNESLRGETWSEIERWIDGLAK